LPVLERSVPNHQETAGSQYSTDGDRQDGWNLFSVAQVSNLLYRRFPIGMVAGRLRVYENSDDSQAGSPAIQQVGNLRYFASQTLNAYDACPTWLACSY